MEDYITLNELYIFNHKLFKKNLKSFIKLNKVSDNDILKMKGNKIGIKKGWIKKNLPGFNLKLKEYDEADSNHFNLKHVLEKYGCKSFNPITLNFTSDCVQYFLVEGERVPHLTQKGLFKIKVLYNDLSDNIFNWIFELNGGKLQSQVNNLKNICEMVKLDHPPIARKEGEQFILEDKVYHINSSDIILDFKRLGDLKAEKNLNFESYKCPLYSMMKSEFDKRLEEAEKNFNICVQQIKQEKVIQHLQQELDKEKSLKDQVLTLTQSMMPIFGGERPTSIHPFETKINGHFKPSPSDISESGSKSGSLRPSTAKLGLGGKLKPSKIL